jgi:hypothetical protein
MIFNKIFFLFIGIKNSFVFVVFLMGSRPPIIVVASDDGGLLKTPANGGQ